MKLRNAHGQVMIEYVVVIALVLGVILASGPVTTGLEQVWAAITSVL